MDIQSFLITLVNKAEEARRLMFSSDIRIITECADQLLQDCVVLRTLIVELIYEELQNLFIELHRLVYNLVQRLEYVLDGFHEQSAPEVRYVVTALRNGNVGRPKYNLTREQLIHLRNLGFTWTAMSKILHVSRQTMHRYKVKMQIENRPRITDEELRIAIRNILHDTPNAGEVYVWGSLRGRNIIVTRQSLRDNLNVVDPIGRGLRRRLTIQRRVYNVRGANYLWHIDSNHKLVNFRFVFHGCVDGYSRTIIYLKCLTNNRAQNVESLFLEGIRNFSIPSRVRGDRGTENIRVARFMINSRGLNRGSFIVGRSVHNQRIERLWAEVNRVVSRHYKQLFHFMEENNILSENNDIDLYCLSRIFLPRIEQSVHEFVLQWNHHGLSTMRGRSPLQLWETCRLEGNFFYGEDCIEDTAYWENPHQYGVIDSDLCPEIETSNNVVVPNNEISLTEEQVTVISNAVLDPLADDHSFGIRHYLTIRNIVNEMLAENS